MRMRITAICMLVILACATGYGQSQSTTPFSLRIVPQLVIPVGRDWSLFTPGAGSAFTAEYLMPFLPMLFAGADVEYSWIPVSGGMTSLSLLNGGIITGLRFDIASIFGLRFFGAAGGYYGFLNDAGGNSGANPFLSAGGGLTIAVNPRFVVDTGVAYRNFLGLYNDISIHVGASYAFGQTGAKPIAQPVQTEKKPVPVTPAPLIENQQKQPVGTKGAGIEVSTSQALSVFPVLFKFYNDNPIGTAVIRNMDTSAAENIRASFLVKQYMDNPKECKAPETLKTGETGAIELYGLFTDSILGISEATLVSANISLEYTMSGKPQKKDFTIALRIQDRNAMSWDMTEKAAAFITPKDPTILKFSKNIASVLKGKASGALNANLLAAVGIHQALDLFGLSYTVDPVTPHSTVSRDPTKVDFLQFPRQTLDYKAGDCDDLTILYCALLESVGVETAFITTPGHIYAAFSLNTSPDDARKAFTHFDDLVFLDGVSWMPVEVTERKDGFVSAWQSGAKAWRENRAKGQAALLPVHASWKKFEAVGFSTDSLPISLPTENAVVRSFTQEILKLIDREISDQVSALQEKARKAQDPSKPVNDLGVLYARYGLYDRAETEFIKVVKKEYVPALVNMGTVLYLRGAYRDALGYYERAQKKEPANALALLGIARANHAIENYGDAKSAYSALQKSDPALAQRFAYLDLRGEEAARAAELSQASSAAVWEERK